MKHDKSKLIEELIVEVKEQVSIVNTRFLKADEQVIQKLSENGGWSIVQCIDHLNSYGHYYLPLIQAALKRTKKDNSQVYKSGWLGDYFTKIMSPETGIKKHKAFKGHIPETNLDARSVVSEFLRQEDLLLQYLEDAKSRDLSVRIPISISKLIRLKLGDTFRFIIVHNRRHIIQAERNLRRFSTPSVVS